MLLVPCCLLEVCHFSCSMQAGGEREKKMCHFNSHIGTYCDLQHLFEIGVHCVRAKHLHFMPASGDFPMCSSSIMLPPYWKHSLLHICICLCPCSPHRSCYPRRLLGSYIYTLSQKAFLNCTRVSPVCLSFWSHWEGSLIMNVIHTAIHWRFCVSFRFEVVGAWAQSLGLSQGWFSQSQGHCAGPA